MSGLVALDNDVVEFNDPALGIDQNGLKKWAQEVKETAQKTDWLAKVLFETRILRWVDPQLTESKRVEDGEVIISRSFALTHVSSIQSEIELEQDVNFGEYDFEDEVNDVKEYLGDATSYGVIFKASAYQSNGDLVGAVYRKFGRLDLIELKNAWEVVNNPSQMLSMGRSVARGISMPSIDPINEFEKLFEMLERE